MLIHRLEDGSFDLLVFLWRHRLVLRRDPQFAQRSAKRFQLCQREPCPELPLKLKQFIVAKLTDRMRHDALGIRVERGHSYAPGIDRIR